MTVVSYGGFITDVESALQRLGLTSHNLGTSSKPGAAIDALYEAFLYFRIVDVVRPLAKSLSAHPHQNKFVVRRQHGELRTTLNKFSYVRFRLKKEYELHVDTFVDTRAAGSRLEADVGLFTAAACHKCRGAAGGRPSHSSLWWFLEAKYFGKSVTTTVAKGFLGTWFMLGRPPKSAAVLVTNQKVDKNAVKLVEGGGCRSYGRVLPLKSCQKPLSAWTADTRAKLRKL